MAATQPSAPKTEAPHRGLAGGIRLGDIKVGKAMGTTAQLDVRELTQDDLSRYWGEVAAELGLKDIMDAGKPRLGEHPGKIEIDAQTVSFHDEFKPHRTEVMQAIRKKCGMPMLDCKVNQLYVEKDTVIYNAKDKYAIMQQKNPALENLLRLLPNISI